MNDPPTNEEALSWRDVQGGTLTVRPVIATPSRFGDALTCSVDIAGHEVSLWDARMIGSYLANLYQALDR